mgnify:FL=1|tara:strand:+ start:452 stop:1045 length:594 start_codon:yes stop_codon:yes gene_type:complete
MTSGLWDDDPLVDEYEDKIIHHSFCIINNTIYKIKHEDSNKLPKDIVSWASKWHFNRHENNESLLQLYKQFVKNPPIKKFKEKDRMLLIDKLWDLFIERATEYEPVSLSGLLYLTRKEEPKVVKKQGVRRQPRVSAETFVSKNGDRKVRLTGKVPVSKTNASRLKYYTNNPIIKEVVEQVTLKALRYDLKVGYIEII